MSRFSDEEVNSVASVGKSPLSSINFDMSTEDFRDYMNYLAEHRPDFIDREELKSELEKSEFDRERTRDIAELCIFHYGLDKFKVETNEFFDENNVEKFRKVVRDFTEEFNSRTDEKIDFGNFSVKENQSDITLKFETEGYSVKSFISKSFSIDMQEIAICDFLNRILTEKESNYWFYECFGEPVLSDHGDFWRFISHSGGSPFYIKNLKPKVKTYCKKKEP